MPKHASGVETSQLCRLLDNIREDPDLIPEEKETIFRWTRDQSRVHTYTESTALMSSLLLHPTFEVVELRVSDDDRFGVRQLPSTYETGFVTGVEGWLDIGTLKILGSARNSERHSAVISDQVRVNDPR